MAEKVKVVALRRFHKTKPGEVVEVRARDVKSLIAMGVIKMIAPVSPPAAPPVVTPPAEPEPPIVPAPVPVPAPATPTAAPRRPAPRRPPTSQKAEG